MFDGVDMTNTQMGSAFLTWDYVNKLRRDVDEGARQRLS